MANEHKKFILFKVLVTVGFVLGVVLLIETITTYHYVAGSMMLQEAERDSQRRVNTLVGAARSAQTQDMETIGVILEDFQEEWNEQVAWIRVVDSRGKTLASAGDPPKEPVAANKLQRTFPGATVELDRKESARGTVLVSVREFRSIVNGSGGGGRGGQRDTGRGEPPGLPPSVSSSASPATGPQIAPNPNEPFTGGPRDGGGARDGGGTPRGGRGARPNFGANWSIELAIFPGSVSGSFASLRRNLIVGISASLTLMTALVLLMTRFPGYLRAQQIERELDLARRVQADLLPSPETISPYVDFSAQCISAWQVGGDYCDVFHVAEDRTAIVLGDVSGKGISAALLMALIHGAIHSVSWTRSIQDHVNSSRQLNALLCKKTAAERFTTLFWGCFDPQRSAIQYINAGHLPPLLVRRNNGKFEIHRLEIGGPVMGLLPDATYEFGEQYIAPGDLFVVFSDGVVEATNPAGDEYGDARLIAVIEKLWEVAPVTIGNAIRESVREFTAGAPLNDDQTIIVVRFKHHPVASTKASTQTAGAATA